MVNVQESTHTIASLAALKYFPTEPEARTAIVQTICEMASDNDQIKWLVRRTLQIYSEWPGLIELRACFCYRFKPRDGITAYSSVYAGGEFPPDPTSRELPSAPVLALPPGRVATADPDLDIKVQALAVATAMPPARPIDSRFSRALFQTITAPQDRDLLPAPSEITPERRQEIQQAIDLEIQKRRESSNVDR